jgi:hypothetical protein
MQPGQPPLYQSRSPISMPSVDRVSPKADIVELVEILREDDKRTAA